MRWLDRAGGMFVCVSVMLCLTQPGEQAGRAASGAQRHTHGDHSEVSDTCMRHVHTSLTPLDTVEHPSFLYV